MRVTGCAVQPFSVDLVQIQHKERLGLTAEHSWTETLIKGEYPVKSSVAVTACWRDREMIACVKRIEVKTEIIMRRMVRVKCEEKAKGKEEYLVYENSMNLLVAKSLRQALQCFLVVSNNC
jgi:hypothetical protein